jgi:acetylornithine/N-succinyldiaminopimelate aminotransferase
MSQEIIKKADQFIAATYRRFPVVIVKGSGSTLWDTEGRKYIDFVSGIAVCNLGHAHPRISQVLTEQSKTLMHVSNLYYTIPQTQLAAWLIEHSFADRSFFCNSGAEANEAAIKLARKYFSSKGESGRYRIIAMKKSFHGRTMATLSATGQDKIRQGFDPLVSGFDFVPFNDVDALKEAIGPATCAVMMEPIQGEGGVRCPQPGYLKSVRKVCDQSGALLIFDEIQTGIGRTGRLFAYEHFDVAPDIMTLAKALANGLPMGAMLAREQVASAFGPGAHASTFGGTPLVSAVALEVLKILEEEKIIEYAAKIGSYFKAQLDGLKNRHKIVLDVRGEGLLLGMKLSEDGTQVVQKCMENGFLINCIQEKILRFAPPLIIEKTEIDALISCLDKILGRL